MEIKTEKELLIELRNKIASRKTENFANAEYWRVVLKTAKKNTQPAVDAVNNIEINNANVKADEVFLKAIDDLIAEQK